MLGLCGDKCWGGCLGKSTALKLQNTASQGLLGMCINESHQVMVVQGSLLVTGSR